MKNAWWMYMSSQKRKRASLSSLEMHQNLEEGTWSSPEWPCKYREITLPIQLRTWVLFAASGSHSQEVKMHSAVLLTSLLSGAHLSPSILNVVLGKAEMLLFKGGVVLLASYCLFWRQSLCTYGEGLLDVSLDSTASGVLWRSILGPVQCL